MAEFSYAANGEQGTVPLEVDAVTAELIFHSSHFLGMDKQDLVAEAVRVYLEQRREEIRHGMARSMRLLDGALGASVTMVAGQPPAQVEDTSPRPVPEAAPPAPEAEPAMHPDQAMVQPEHHFQDAQMARHNHVVSDAQFHQG